MGAGPEKLLVFLLLPINQIFAEAKVKFFMHSFSICLCHVQTNGTSLCSFEDYSIFLSAHMYICEYTHTHWLLYGKKFVLTIVDHISEMAFENE